MTPPILFFVLALVLFAVEIFVLQFAVIWVAVFGLGAFIAAIAGYLFPGLDWSGVIAVFVGASCLICVGLFKPLRRWQSNSGSVAGNDAIGQSVEVLKNIAPGITGQVHWSGTDWRAALAEGESGEIAEGQRAEIVSLSGITLYVKAV